MEYRFLGKTGVKVSKLCFGTMTFGNEADEETSATMYRRCEMPASTSSIRPTYMPAVNQRLFSGA